MSTQDQRKEIDEDESWVLGEGRAGFLPGCSGVLVLRGMDG